MQLLGSARRGQDAGESFDIGLGVQMHVRTTFLHSFVEVKELGRIFTGKRFLASGAGHRVLAEDGLIAAHERVLTQIGAASVGVFGHVTHVEDLAVVVDVGVNAFFRADERAVDRLAQDQFGSVRQQVVGFALVTSQAAGVDHGQQGGCTCPEGKRRN
jgi:predicted nucleotidyltransferase